MSEDCQRCRADVDRLREDVDRLLEEKDRRIQGEIEAIYRSIDSRFDGSDRIHGQRFDSLANWIIEKFRSLQLAVDKAEEQIREKLAEMNKVREQLDRQAGTFATKEWVEALLRPIADKLSEISSFVSNWQGRSAVWGVVWGIVILAFSVFLPIILRWQPSVAP
jgi:hypothetical protein